MLKNIFLSMTTNYLISQLIGLLSLTTLIISYFVKNRKHFFIAQIIANLFITASYFFLGTYFASIGVALATIRTLVFLIFEKQNKEVPNWLVATFCIILAINCIIFWNSIFDILPLIALCLYTISFKQKDSKKMKKIILLANIMFLSFNLLNLDIIGSICKSIELIALIIAIIKLTKQKETKQTTEIIQIIPLTEETNTDIIIDNNNTEVA